MKKIKSYQEWLDEELKDKATAVLSMPILGSFLHILIFQIAYPLYYVCYRIENRKKTEKQLFMKQKRIQRKQNRQLAKELKKQVLNPNIKMGEFLKNCEEIFNKTRKTL